MAQFDMSGQRVAHQFNVGSDDTLREIKATAQDALNTGQTWHSTDRLKYLEEALERIVKLCGASAKG